MAVELAVNIQTGVIVAFGLFLLGLLWQLRESLNRVATDIKSDIANLRTEMVRSTGDLKSQITPIAQGLQWIQKASEPGSKRANPLSEQDLVRKQELLEKGKKYGLLASEAGELQALLEEEARDDFAKGVLTAAAFAVAAIGIIALIGALSKKQAQV